MIITEGLKRLRLKGSCMRTMTRNTWRRIIKCVRDRICDNCKILRLEHLYVENRKLKGKDMIYEELLLLSIGFKAV